MKLNIKKRSVSFLSLLTMFSMVIGGCGSSGSSASRPDPNMSLNIETTANILSTGQLGKPWLQSSFASSRMYRNLFEAFAGELDVQPDLVDTYTVSDDGLVYEFKLKEDSIWSDGEALDVEDVVFSIESFLILAETENINTLFLTNFSDIVGVTEFLANPSGGLSGLSTTGSDIITITLNNPNSMLLQALAQFAIFPEHALAQFGAENLFEADIDYWDDPVVSGMYKLGEHIVDESVTLVYNDKYTRDVPYINSIVMRADFEYEEIGFAETNNVTRILDSRAISSLREYEVNSTFYRYFIFNIDKLGEIDPVLSDDRVRRAFMHAIDREEIVSEVYYSIGTVNNSPIVQEYDKAIEFDYYYDPEKALELLEEAEYDFDRPVTLLYYYNDDISIKFMEECAKYFEDIGLTTDLVQGNYLFEEYDYYDFALKGLSVFSIDDWYNEYLSSSQLHMNVFGGDPMFDDLVNELKRAITQEERNETLVKLQELEYEIFYKYPLFLMGYKVYLGNNVSIPDDVLFGNSNYRYNLDFAEWKID